METKHTKSNWTAFSSGDRFYVGYDGATFNNLLAEVYAPENAKEGEEEANAKLIASAPDLLEALIQLKNWVGKLEDWKGIDPPFELVDKAIAKATGQTI